MEIIALLKTAIERRASDLHLTPQLPPMLRIDGDLVSIQNVPVLTRESAKQLIYSVMTSEEQNKFENRLALEIPYHTEGSGNFRVSLLHQLNGVAAVFRVIPDIVPSFEKLGLPEILKSLLVLSQGLIIVSGATGSGKTTTLAVMIDYINSMRPSHIVTIEDPIEFTYRCKRSIVNQLQVGRDTPNIAAALRASLRQDPNIIMLGEMRDLETVRLALTAAETGQLVLATLHANSAPIAISRIVDMFPSEERNRVRMLLAETLQAVLCQQLVKRTSGGRVAAIEIMLANPAIRHLIRQDKIAHMMMTIQTNGDMGMCTMEQSLQELLSKRLISMGAARTANTSRGSFRTEL